MKFFKRNSAPLSGRRARTQQATSLPVRRSANTQQDRTFVRNRTLTNVMNEEIGAKTTNGRAHLHVLHRQRRFLRIALVICAAAIIIVGFLILNRVSALSIALDDNGVRFSEQDKVDIQTTFKKYIDQHPTQTFVVSLQNQEFFKLLIADHPEIKQLSLTSNSFGLTHSLHVTFRQPLLQWNVAGKQYYVDSDGVLFENNHFVTPKVSVEDQSGIAFSDGSAIPQRLIRYIGRMAGALQTNQIGIVSRVVVPASSREVDIYLEGRDFAIKTHIDRDAYATAGDIKSSLSYLDGKGIKPQYIDVRIEGKAFYK
jgi:hypothetical protein